MRRRHTSPSRPEPPNLTPVVNIAMVVLVVFMLTVSFIEPQRYMQSQTALLEQGGQSNFDPDWTPPTPLPILLSTATPAAFVADVGGQQTSDRDELIAILTGKQEAFEQQAGTPAEDVQVEISPQRGTSYQHYITVYEAAQLAGFSNIAPTPVR